MSEFGGTYRVTREAWDDADRTALAGHLIRSAQVQAERRGFTPCGEWRVEVDPQDLLFRRPVIAVAVLGEVADDDE